MTKDDFERAVSERRAIRLTAAKARNLQESGATIANLKGYRLVWRAGQMIAFPPKGIDIIIFKQAIP